MAESDARNVVPSSAIITWPSPLAILAAEVAEGEGREVVTVSETLASEAAFAFETKNNPIKRIRQERIALFLIRPSI